MVPPPGCSLRERSSPWRRTARSWGPSRRDRDSVCLRPLRSPVHSGQAAREEHAEPEACQFRDHGIMDTAEVSLLERRIHLLALASRPGGVAERLNAPVLKTVERVLTPLPPTSPFPSIARPKTAIYQGKRGLDRRPNQQSCCVNERQRTTRFAEVRSPDVPPRALRLPPTRGEPPSYTEHLSAQFSDMMIR